MIHGPFLVLKLFPLHCSVWPFICPFAANRTEPCLDHFHFSSIMVFVSKTSLFSRAFSCSLSLSCPWSPRAPPPSSPWSPPSPSPLSSVPLPLLGQSYRRFLFHFQFQFMETFIIFYFTQLWLKSMMSQIYIWSIFLVNFIRLHNCIRNCWNWKSRWGRQLRA